MGRKDGWEAWGMRFREHCRKQEIKRADLAEKMGLDADSTIRHWENGTRSPKLTDFFKLCLLAKADPAQILFGAQPVTQEQRKKLRELVDTLG